MLAAEATYAGTCRYTTRAYPMRFYSLTVSSISTETPDAYTLSFVNPDPEVFAYKPGQYLTLRLFINGKDERRAFSLSSTPRHNKELSVTIKRISGGLVTNYIPENIEPGDTIDVLPPMGKFTVDIDPTAARHFVMIGGGSGITPLMSMTRAILAEEPKSDITLLYANHNKNSIIFRQELDKLEAQHGGRLKVVHVLSNEPEPWEGCETGLMIGQLLGSLLEQAVNRSSLAPGYYLCGPSGLMAEVKNVLAARGVPNEQVHTEYYSAPLPTEATDDEAEDGEEIILKEERVRVRLDGKEQELIIAPDKTILVAAQEAGMDPPYACEEGVCCTCRAKLLAGQVIMDESEGLSDEEIDAGFILTCQSHPMDSDVVVEYG